MFCVVVTVVLLNVLLFSALSNGCGGVDCGHGSCSSLVSGGYGCRCMFGYTGDNCQTGEILDFGLALLDRIIIGKGIKLFYLAMYAGHLKSIPFLTIISLF